MSNQAVQVQPVEVGYYQQGDETALAVVRAVAVIGLLYGASVLVQGFLMVGSRFIGGPSMIFGFTREWWYVLIVVLTIALAVLLIVGGIACLRLKRSGRTLMLTYAVGAGGVAMFSAGFNAYRMLTTNWGGAAAPWNNPVDVAMLLGMYLGQLLQDLAFPVIIIVLMRVGPIARLFGR